MDEKISFLINPISGGGEGRRILSYIPQIMNSLEIDQNRWIAELTDPEHLNSQMDRMLNRGGRLIAVGGDGTMTAVLNRALQLKQQNTLLGLIPLGTGNDLARAMGIYRNYMEKGLVNTIRKLLWTQGRFFDLWSVNKEWTLGAYLSVGLDAKIAKEFNEDRKAGKIPGKSVWLNKAYYIKVFARLRKHRLPVGSSATWVDHQGRVKQQDLAGRRSFILGNIPSYAGGANPFRGVNYQDELLEVVLVRSFWQFIGCILTNISRTYSSFFTRFIVPTAHARSVCLKLPTNAFVQVDGEDFTNKLAGGEVEISFGGKVQLLVLDPW
jgi:diacylglycerol kinase family enzyme